MARKVKPMAYLGIALIAAAMLIGGMAMSDALGQEPNVIPVPRELMERMAAERLAIIGELNRLEQQIDMLERANATLRAKLACV